MKRAFFSRLWKVALAMSLSCTFYMCSSSDDDNYFGLDFTWKDPIVDGALQITTSLNRYNKDEKDLVFTWDFGERNTPQSLDENIRHQKNPLYQYTKNGKFNVTLQVMDQTTGEVSSITKTISVIDRNQPTPSATIDSAIPTLFGMRIMGMTKKGEKYEPADPNPEFRLEISLSPSFDTLSPIDGDSTYRLLPVNAAYSININQLFPGNVYYARIRTKRFSKKKVVEEVSQSSTNIQVVRIPFIQLVLNVDTVSNAELAIIKASLPPGAITRDEDRKVSVLRDGIPFTPDLIAPGVDSIFYREPGSHMHFIFEYAYTHPYYSSRKATATSTVDIYTPNCVIHYNNDILQSDSIYRITTRNENNILKNRNIQFIDLDMVTGANITISWNHAPDDNSSFLSSADPVYTNGLPFFRSRGQQDAYSYFTLGTNGTTYFHQSDAKNTFGYMYIYREDRDYIYARMTVSNVGNSYRVGYLMLNPSVGSQQNKEIYMKGFVFKLRKNPLP